MAVVLVGELVLGMEEALGTVLAKGWVGESVPEMGVALATVSEMVLGRV